MANALEGLSQEEMVALAAEVNAGSTDASVTDDENAARQASGKEKTDTPKGSQSVEELAAEAAAFKAKEEPTAEEVLGEAAAEEVAEEKVEEKKVEAENREFPTSNDPNLKAALGLMKASGMSGDDVSKHFGAAISSGNTDDVDMEALTKVLGEDKAMLVMAGVTKWSADAGAEALEAARQVQESVGGAGNWSKMTAWAKKAAKADPEVKAQIEDITGMLNGNATSRKLGAAEFQRLYNSDATNSTVGKAKTIEGNAPAKVKLEPLSASQSYQAKEALSRQRQLGKVTHAEYNAGMAKIKRQRDASR